MTALATARPKNRRQADTAENPPLDITSGTLNPTLMLTGSPHPDIEGKKNWRRVKEAAAANAATTATRNEADSIGYRLWHYCSKNCARWPSLERGRGSGP